MGGNMGSKHACACVCVQVGVGKTVLTLYSEQGQITGLSNTVCAAFVYVYQAASLCPVHEGQHVRMTESVNIDHLRRFRLGLFQE